MQQQTRNETHKPFPAVCTHKTNVHRQAKGTLELSTVPSQLWSGTHELPPVRNILLCKTPKTTTTSAQKNRPALNNSSHYPEMIFSAQTVFREI